jgi:DNA primase
VAGFDLTTAEGRVAAVRKAAPLVARIRDAALRPEYSRLLSGWVGVPEGEVRAAVSAAARAGAGPARGGSAGRPGGRPGEQYGERSGAGRQESAAGAAGPGDSDRDTPGGGTEATATSPERAPRPNPRDPGLFVERESLKCVLQVPDLVGDWFDSVQPGSFRHPRYAEVQQALVAAGGPAGRTGGQEWMDVVMTACPDDTVRDLVRELAVEPLVTSGDPTGRYATSIVARLLSDEAGRRLADLKRELGQLDQIGQADQAAAVFADVMALEAYRRELAQVGQAED